MTERTLLFTDLVDSTQLVARLGDARAAQLWGEHDRRARQLLDAHRGREIDRSDGFFLLFDDVADAAHYALAYHQAIAGLDLTARIGIHVGAVTLRENDPQDVARGAKRTEVEGLAKPFAARIMALACGGQTLLSASAWAALIGSTPDRSEIDSHGHYRLKGVEEPAEIFELGVRGQSAFSPPPDTDKVYRVVRADGLWRPLREVRHNLMPERDAFVGRTAELRELARRLDAGARLLTMLGPGGTGKTRLVRRYSRAWLGDWPGGVYFCDLSEARSLDGIYFAVAFALGVPLGKSDPGVQLGHAIAGRGRCLVILDNFEQVVEHASVTLGRWLDRAADAALLVTSRELLHLPGEEVFQIEPLPLDKDAIELFAVRARSQRPDFVLGDANRAAVAEVVRLLDGLPLAIELAAARTRVLAPHQLVERMKDRFQLLAGGRGTAARQATLRAAIDWSWEMLTPWEKAALAQCSVFEGGFTIEGAEAVLDLSTWPPAPSPLDAVQSLVDKSLLRTWIPLEQGRFDLEQPFFGMYLSIHEYAADKLAAFGPGAMLAAQERHGRHFAGFGTDEAIEALSLHGGVRKRRSLALELDNLVAACHRAIAGCAAGTAVATYRAAWEVLNLQGPFDLGVALGTQVLSLPEATPALRTTASAVRGRAARLAGRAEQASSWLEEALALARSMPDRRLQGIVHESLGSLLSDHGRMEQARVHLDAAIAIGREVGNRRSEGCALSGLGIVHLRQGRMEDARVHLEAAVAIDREVGNRHDEGIALGNLASLNRVQCRFEEALEYYQRALAVHREVGNRFREGIDLGNVGNLSLDRGQMEQARTHYEAALVIHREIGNRRSEGIVLGNLGMLFREQGRFDQARARFEAALAVAREVGNRQSEGLVLSALGELNRDEGRFDDGLSYCDQSLVASRAAGDRHAEGWTHGLRGDLLSSQGRGDEARAAVRTGEVLLREVGDRLGMAKLECIRGRLDACDGDLDAARAALAAAESTAKALDAGPDSDLSHEIARLRRAIA